MLLVSAETQVCNGHWAGLAFPEATLSDLCSCLPPSLGKTDRHTAS